MLSVWLIISTAVLIVIDQLTKMWAVEQLHHADRVIPVVDGVFELRYTENPGVAFSMLEGQKWIFIPLTLVIGGLILVMLLRSPLRKKVLFDVTGVLILAGAIGNLIDRIAYGYVIDFLYFRLIDFPIFNFADCCVVIGAFLLFFFVLFGMKGEEDTPLLTLFFGINKRDEENNNG